MQLYTLKQEHSHDVADGIADAFLVDPVKIWEPNMTPSRDLSGHVLPQTPSMQPPSWAMISGTTDTPYAGPQGSDLPISSPFQVRKLP